jgi:hypothetical protein
LSQLAQLGSFWSQRFLRKRQRLHALTLRKLLLWPTLLDPARLATSTAMSPPPGEVAPPADSEVGESLSDEDCRARLLGKAVGDGMECAGIVPELSDVRSSHGS